jgi:hypothetical protein
MSQNMNQLAHISICLLCIGTNTMFCQEANATGTTYSLAVWNGSIADTATWMAITNGVQLYVQTGLLCAAAGNLPRDTAIQFICDRTATRPRFMNVTEQGLFSQSLNQSNQIISYCILCSLMVCIHLIPDFHRDLLLRGSSTDRSRL